MPTNLHFLCRFVLIRNRPTFPRDSSCDPIFCRRFRILANAYFLQPPKFPVAKLIVNYIPLVSKSNKDMGFVENLSYMDVVLLVASNFPTKPPRFADLLLLAV